MAVGSKVARERRVERISQSTVEISAADSAATFLEIRQLVIDWLAEKSGGKLPETILRGETDEFDPIGFQRVETAALEDLSYWAARQDDQDRILPRRTWVTEAAIAPNGSTRVLVGHRLHCATLGDTAPFSRSVPRFMKEIGRRFTTFLDGVECGPSASVVETQDDVERLVALLTKETRRHPIIGISDDRSVLPKTGTAIDADKLAADIFGTAHVFSIQRAAGFLLTDAIGKDFSVYNGGVRSWRAPLTLDDSPFSHPLALPRHIEGWGPQGSGSFRRELVDWVLRHSARRADADAALPPFAEARHAAARNLRSRAEQAGQSDRQLLDLALAENDQLTAELNEQKQEHEQLLTLADEDARRMQVERDEALTEIQRLRFRIDHLEDALTRQRDDPALEIPNDLVNLDEWAEANLGGLVVVLPRAANLAKKSPFEDVPLVYRALLLMRDAYVPMRRNGDTERKAAWEDGLNELGLAVSKSFAGSGAGEFGDEYKVQWNDKNFDLDMHLKGSNSRDPRYGFRCYFCWDDDEEVAVIGALPGHLTNRAT